MFWFRRLKWCLDNGFKWNEGFYKDDERWITYVGIKILKNISIKKSAYIHIMAIESVGLGGSFAATWERIES